MTASPRRELSLAHLTVLDAPPELVSVAAAAGAQRAHRAMRGLLENT